MRRFISILFLSLMMLQAIPVLHFFSSQSEVFYVYIDEEKPDEKSKEKKEVKESLSLHLEVPVLLRIETLFNLTTERSYRSPLLEFLTPPPDAC